MTKCDSAMKSALTVESEWTVTLHAITDTQTQHIIKTKLVTNKTGYKQGYERLSL